MNDILVYVGIGLMLIALVIGFQFLNVRFSRILSKHLYQDLDADTYISELDSFQAKLFIRRKRRELLKLDAYAFKEDKNGVEDQFELLESMNLSYGQKITLYEKEVQYYSNVHEDEKALKAFDILTDLGSKIDDEKMLRVLEEAEIMIEVYIKRNPDFAEKLVDMAKRSKHPINKGLYYYKACKCFYYKNDKANVTKYLRKAHDNLHSDVWRSHINACLEDFSNLEKK